MQQKHYGQQLKQLKVMYKATKVLQATTKAIRYDRFKGTNTLQATTKTIKSDIIINTNTTGNN